MEFLISCSIVLYKPDITIRKTINAFLNTTLPVKLYLIDNSPTDKLRIDLGKFLENNKVEYIFNNANIGFGAGHNIALRRTINNSAYHLVLNPDVTFNTGVLESLLKYMDENTNVGLVIPKVYHEDGKTQYVCKLLPAPIDLISRRFLPANFFRSRRLRFELRQMPDDVEFEAPYIHGCFMFLRTEALKKVGLFDERFFMYPDDIDLTRRMYKKYKTMCYPKVSIVHKHEKGSYKDVSLLWIHIVNMIKYFNKWGWFFDKERREINNKILSQFDKNLNCKKDL
ncbi:MAG TPA: glycosyltransferase family 2 protein [Segetibacter sp.]|jgi:hypothetical protein